MTENIKEYEKALEKAILIIKDLLDHIDALESCDCGGSGLCSVCESHNFLEEIEEDFDIY